MSAIATGSVTQVRERFDVWALGRKHALRAASAMRITLAVSVLGLLASNFSTRAMWVGQGSVWADPAREVSRFPEVALLDGVSADIVTLVYVLTMAAAVALLLGWHAKAATVLTFVGFIAIVAQNPVVGTQSDNLVRLALLWMLLMRTAEHWSLDARHRRRVAAGAAKARSRDEDVLPGWLSTGLHNVGLLGLGAQTVLIYTAGGLDKVSQDVWQHGTALFYTLQLPESRPFPWLSDLVGGSTAVLAVLTYAVLGVQLFFGPLLLNPVTRRLLVVLAIVLNLFFGVVLGSLWSSLATVAVTLLFVPDTMLARIEEAVGRATDPAVDWIIERWYAVVDVLDDLRYRFVLPAVDWVRDRILRR